MSRRQTSKTAPKWTRCAKTCSRPQATQCNWLVRIRGYKGAAASKAAPNNGIDLQIVKLPEVKKDLELLLRPWVEREASAG